MKMKAAIQRAWLKALRSGQYTQGTGMLRTPDAKSRFCCLGVLCDLHSQSLKRSGWRKRDGHWHYGTRYEEAILSPGVMRWAGLRSRDPIVAHKGETSLADLNDSNHSFKYIARVSEKQL